MKRSRQRWFRWALVAVALGVGISFGATIACGGRDTSRRPAVVTAPLAVDATELEAPDGLAPAR
jgi:hypothetical protein